MPSATSNAAAENKAALDRYKDALKRKREVDKRLAQLETSIYAFEGSYLADTALTGGNIIKGFDGYMKTTQTNKRKQDAQDQDRLFSLSSMTWSDSLKLQAQYDEKDKQQRGAQS